jgi:hypothetical protein
MSTKQPKTEYDPSQPLKSSRQELFCQKYTQGMSASEAYRQAGYAQKNADTNSAMLMVKNGIVARIAYLRAKEAKKEEITRESLAKDYGQAFDLSVKLEVPQGMVQATAGRARLYGYEKQVIETTEQAPEMDAAEEALYREFLAWRQNRATGGPSGDLGPGGPISTTNRHTGDQEAIQEPEYAVDWTHDSQDQHNTCPVGGKGPEQDHQE